MNIKTVVTEEELNAFIDFPYTLYKGNPFWVGELKSDTKKLLTTDPFWAHARRELFLAYDNGRVAGRIAAVINDTHNEYWHENAGFFGFFECINDPRIARELFKSAQTYLKSAGAAFMRGPFNPSSNHTCGLLIDNYDKRPFIMMPYNFDYYPTLIENAGLRKTKDLLAFERTQAHQYSPRMQKILDRLNKRSGITLRPINIKNFEQEVMAVKEIYNASWAKNWGFLPIGDAEILNMGRELKPILVPALTAIAEQNGQKIGFYISIPDMNAVLRHLRGSFKNPLGALRALWAWKKLKECRLIMLGVAPEHRGKGAELMLIDHIIKNGTARGWQKAELSWILEDNKDIIAVITEAGCTQTKRYRVYEILL